MPENSNNQGLLSSWKEIASYLNCDERTCRRWELNFGLPVHRMEGTQKSRVYAYTHELDAWRSERLNGITDKKGKESAGTITHRVSAPKMLLWILPPLAVAIAAAIFLLRPSPGQPADFRIQGSKLIILDEKGKELWDFDTGLPNLELEEAYRERFQIPVWSVEYARSLPPFLVMKDINQDGQAEVLFSTQAKPDHRSGEGDLYCFSAKGKQLWHHKVGREVEFGGRAYSADYRIIGFVPLDYDENGNLEIILYAFHSPHSPTQLLIYNSNGNLVGEFTNWGRMYDFLVHDLDGDGRKELLVSGQNDEYGKGCLIVFDPAQVSGCSPQSVESPGPGLEPGSEKYYLLFPRTDVDQTLHPLPEGMIDIDLLQNGRIQLVSSTSNLFFELDLELRLQDVKGSDTFRLKHRELKAAGKISSVLDNAYYEALKPGVLYWDGEQWTSTPSMNANWNKPR